MLRFILSIFSAISAVFEWINRTAPERKEKELGKKIEDTKEAVYSHNADKVNAKLDDLLKCVAVAFVGGAIGVCNISCVSSPVHIDGSLAAMPLNMTAPNLIREALQSVNKIEPKDEHQKLLQDKTRQSLTDALSAAGLLSYEARSGWWVPDARMAQIMERLERAKAAGVR